MRNQKARSSRCRNFVTGAALVALSSTGFAQPARAAESEQLVEVVVTAQKRAENLQRVPLAVTAFSATMLEDKQITSAFDLAQYTPNVQFSGVGAASASAGAFYIRGVGQFNMHATSDPAVGVYLDGVYIARSVGSNFDLGDVAQVEVLKGPQGTLFGRNTITGAVSITTKRPTFESGGSADLTVGSIDQVLARATVNAPLVDGKLAARFTIMGNERAAWGTEIDSKGKVWNLGDAQRMGGRAQLLWQVSDDLDVLFSGDGTRSRGHSTPGGLTAFTPSATSNAFNATSPVKVGPQWLVQGYTSFLNIVPNDNVDTAGASMTVTWKPRDVTIKAISAYRQQYAQTAQDFGGVPVSWITQQMTQTQWQISQELQATGDLLNGRLKYTGGLYYFEEKSHNDTWAGLFGSDLVIPATNSVRSASAYGQATYDLTDKLSITGGARYTEERKSIRVQTTLSGAVVLPDSSASAKFHSVTPMANIKYQWTDDVMTYASIARGFRSGGFNAQPFSTTDLIPTNPEKTTTYEVGAKLTGFNNRVRLNLAAFYNDYTDIQLGATTLTNGVFVYRNANAATATIYGGEMELTGVIAPGLEAYLNGSYLHSKIAPVAGFTFGNTQLPSAPKFMVQAGVKYAFSLKNQGTLTLDADTNFRTGAWPQFNPSAASRQPAYALFNARSIFEPLGSPWTFSIWAKNLTDKKYTNFGQTSGSGDVTVGWFGRPREVGATAAVKF